VAYEDLVKTYDAVYLAIGAKRAQVWPWKGKPQGSGGAVEFLRDVNLGKTPRVGERVAVVGGGNSAIDASRSALRWAPRK